ncbi:MAG: monovalent cation:proton antiporter-2 (CPA2) family protein [Dyella sp.]
MDNHHFLQTAVVFLLATVIAVPLTKRFRLGAVLGYLLAGMVIGPQALGLVGDTAGVTTISEFGVVLMLFVIGLELSPQRLWVMRRSVFGTGLLQVLTAGAAISLLASYLFGLRAGAAAIIGGSLALSSTAFGLQILAERKEAGSAYGRQAFAILLFQDLAAIPLIAAVPLLATSAQTQAVDPFSIARTVGVILAVVVGGRYLLRPIFRFIARSGAVEVSTATALLVVMGTAWLMELGGVSTTLGAFLAGMLLADSEYRHELESNIEPFKGLLLGLFFISVGMSMDISLLLSQPWLILGLVLGLLSLKGVLLWPLGLAGGLSRADALRLAMLLACGGEFAFVTLKLAQDRGLVDVTVHDTLVLAITVSMALTPLLVLLAARLVNVLPSTPPREYDRIDPQAPPRVIIAGFGRMGQIVARVLRAQRIAFVALEHSVDQVDNLRRFGTLNVYFGDPTRAELLRAAGADKAEVFVLATDDPETSLRTAQLVKKQFPHLRIIARARNRQHVFRLMDMGIEEPVRETFHSSLKLTRKTLEALGLSTELATDRVERFRRQDEKLLQTQALIFDDETKLVQSTREAINDLQDIFEADIEPRTERERDKPSATPLPDQS